MHRQSLHPDAAPMLPAVHGFEHIARGWDGNFGRWTAKILPGELFVTRHDEAISTVLGSCVSACVRDPLLKVGGMNHFMLPAQKGSGHDSWMVGPGSLATRYGSHAMEKLINELMKLGARRDRLEVKVFGGGNILAAATDVGAANASFVRQFLAMEKLPVVAEDLGDIYPRRVVYLPATGSAMVKRLPALESRAIATRESQYGKSLAVEAVEAEDDVELFN